MALSSISPVAAYISAQKDEETAAANYAKADATTKNEVAAFEKAAPSITSVDGLLKNYSALQVVLGAYNLSSISTETALIKDLLTQDPTSSTSLAKKSANATWLAFADAFTTWGQNDGTASTTPFTSDTISSIVTMFQERQFENSSSNQDNGVGNALYFTRKMSGVTTLSQVMSDPTLLNVVETVSGYNPDEFGALDYSQQVRLLQNKVDLKTLSTPQEIQQYAERYLAMLQINPQTPDKPASLMDLFGGDTSDEGILALFDTSSSSTSTGSIYSGLF
ncbi:hypothetical protein AA13595_0961 [Gluconacetobacter johannae DSM 13595]|uniref:DUF1217 domain-containing protein n=1 Tax=Gluconacetobacter johannae TaxID=112140 RepID=A0A7W4J9R3_9PROT|nr:DUF1217 domain-containing protein [Gluconacetobacter johannae]MBB2177301.1 DUF1217 domain-containing protein [Gluconacetobacter johannae]GBQ82579.1 hypothetical protein AA13595_0961 [Gluconacetobacter johannae DSM 13595]